MINGIVPFCFAIWNGVTYPNRSNHQPPFEMSLYRRILRVPWVYPVSNKNILCIMQQDYNYGEHTKTRIFRSHYAEREEILLTASNTERKDFTKGWTGTKINLLVENRITWFSATSAVLLYCCLL